jgi:peptidoglycan/xylan/chitin deacetylase (PgdA/CDA1 family)
MHNISLYARKKEGFMSSVWLMYHDVFKTRPDPGLPISATMYHVSQEVFCRHLDEVQKSGKPVTKVSDLLSGSSADSVVFTFDDGWAGVYESVLPLFKARGWNAIIFVTRDFIDRKGFLTREQIMELSQSGFEIGVHGTTHRMLSACKDDMIFWELATCKEFIEKLINQPAVYASLPGGDETPRLVAIAKEIGLKAVCTSRPGINHSMSSTYALKRIAINKNTSSKDIQRYCRFSFRPEKLHWLAFQVPRQLLGSKNYVLLRRVLLGENQRSENEIFNP